MIFLHSTPGEVAADGLLVLARRLLRRRAVELLPREPVLVLLEAGEEGGDGWLGASGWARAGAGDVELDGLLAGGVEDSGQVVDALAFCRCSWPSGRRG